MEIQKLYTRSSSLSSKRCSDSSGKGKKKMMSKRRTLSPCTKRSIESGTESHRKSNSFTMSLPPTVASTASTRSTDSSTRNMPNQSSLTARASRLLKRNKEKRQRKAEASKMVKISSEISLSKEKINLDKSTSCSSSISHGPESSPTPTPSQIYINDEEDESFSFPSLSFQSNQVNDTTAVNKDIVFHKKIQTSTTEVLEVNQTNKHSHSPTSTISIDKPENENKNDSNLHLYLTGDESQVATQDAMKMYTFVGDLSILTSDETLDIYNTSLIVQETGFEDDEDSPSNAAGKVAFQNDKNRTSSNHISDICTCKSSVTESTAADTHDCQTFIMTMEKYGDDEGIEIYDTEHFVRSIAYGVQSAQEAEKTREKIKQEWTTGKVLRIEEDVTDDISVATLERMNFVNETARQAISSLCSVVDNNVKVVTPPRFNIDTDVPDELTILQLKAKMKKPSRAIADLLNAILQGGKWSRRKNACGALKVLSWKNPHGMAFTDGVLTTIACVFNDSDSRDGGLAIIDVEKEAFYDARSRTVLALVNLCKVHKNRILIIHTPGLMQSLLKVIQCDRLDSRQGVCECLALLAKTKENRVHMLKVPNLVSTLTSVISLRADIDQISRPVSTNSTLSDCSTEEDSQTVECSDDDDGSSFDSLSDNEEIKLVVDIDPTYQYDNLDRPYLIGARVHTFAALIHLAKNKSNAYFLARDESFISSINEVGEMFSSPSHTKSIIVLAHLSRLKFNNHQMIFRMSNVVTTLIHACQSTDPECRKYACFALQNLSIDKTCRQELAILPGLLAALSACARHDDFEEEQLAAVSAIRNLSDEYANIIQISNTLDFIPTIIDLSQNTLPSANKLVPYYTSDSLAYLSRSLRSISDNGIMLCVQEKKESMVNLPSNQICSWNQWL